MSSDRRPLIVACGALVSELRAVLARNGLAESIEVRYLPPAETTRVLERETADWAKAIKAANIRMD